MYHESPKGRTVERVDGDPDSIIKRGKQITELGEAMTLAAETLSNIKDSEIDGESQRGKVIEELKKSVGDANETLAEAADLYTPVGPVIKTYGESLQEVQPTINSNADTAQEKWSYYLSLPGDAEGNMTPEADGGFLGMGGHDADSPEAKQEAEENQAKKAAYDDWKVYADAFDAGYDTWEQAFDDAVGGMTEGLSGSIEDSIWADFTDFLEIAAMVIGIAAIIFGGPILAALALVVALALVFTTIMAYKNGERSGMDIALAVAGVLPFGKISSLTKVVQSGRVVKNMGIRNIGTFVRSGKQILNPGRFSGLRANASAWRSRNFFHADGLVGLYRGAGGPRSALRMFTTGNADTFAKQHRNYRSYFHGPGLDGVRSGTFTKRLAQIDLGATALGTNATYYNWADKMTGDDALPNIPKPSGFFI